MASLNFMQTPTSTKLQPIQLSLLLAFGMVAGAHAQGTLADQSLQFPPAGTHGFHAFESLATSLVPATGQEFTPSLQGVDFVDVNLFNPTVTYTGTFAIAIHAGNMAAPVFGLSAQVVRSGGSAQSNTHFTFPTTLAVTAGDLYVFEVLQLAGDSGWTIEVPLSAVVDGQTIDMNYPGGRLIYGGVPLDNQDMIFREGITVPEPGVTALCLLGVLAFGLAGRIVTGRTV
jgi:hypothetical protein